MMNMKRVLTIAPHSDDEAFGCGVFLRRFNGEKSIVLMACSTVKHRDGVVASCADRSKEFFAVCDVLGATGLNKAYPDGKLHEQRTTIIKGIEDSIDMFKPDTLLIPYKSFHQDHQTVYECAFTATRPGRTPTVKNVICYEVPNYVHHTEEDRFEPNYFLTFDEMELAEKLDLCRIYGSQVGRKKSPITLKTVKAHAQYRGYQCGASYAEAFRIIRSMTNGF